MPHVQSCFTGVKAGEMAVTHSEGARSPRQGFSPSVLLERGHNRVPRGGLASTVIRKHLRAQPGVARTRLHAFGLLQKTVSSFKRGHMHTSAMSHAPWRMRNDGPCLQLQLQHALVMSCEV